MIIGYLYVIYIVKISPTSYLIPHTSYLSEAVISHVISKFKKFARHGENR